MDDSKERRKSVKSRRRSLRTLQPADIGSFVVDQDESHDTTLDCQPMYGSIWIEKEETPTRVRKPRRSISCSQISQDLANSVIRNKKNIYGKENFSPDPSPIKMVEDTPKRTPVLHTAKASNNSVDNCSTENVWNQENSYEEIGVPRFGHRTLDGSVTEESLVGSISIMSLDETDLQSQAQKVNHSVEDELQISLGSFSKKEPNSIGTENISLSLDQITDPDSSFIEESSQTSLDCLLDSEQSHSESPAAVVCEIASPVYQVESRVPNDNLCVSSGEIIPDVSSKDSPPFSSKLCQDFKQLDLSEDVTPGSDSETTVVSEESDVETLPENTLDPSLSSDGTFNSGLLDDSSLDECGSLTSDSWCFVKCYPDEKSSDVSSLNDTSVSDGCELWETDLSSAGSELSDSWCFSSHLNTAGHFNSTPCKTPCPISPLVNNDQCLESVEHLHFATEDEIISEQETTVPDNVSSSGHLTMELSTAPLEEGEQKLPALENLNLEDSSSGSNEECQNQMQGESQIKETELSSTPNDKPTKGKLVKTIPESVSKTTTKQITDSKTKKMISSVKNPFQSTKRKQIINSEKTVSSQTPTSTTIHNKSSQDPTRKVTSIRTKRPTTLNTKIDPSNKGKLSSDSNELKSSINPKKNPGIKKEPTTGTFRSNKQSSKLEENSIKSLSKQQHPPKAASPDVIILDTLVTSAKTNTAIPPEEKVKTSSINKSTKPLSTEKQKALKGSSKTLPAEMSLHKSDPNLSLPQLDSETIPDSFEEIKTKSETLLESPIKKRPRKGINSATSNQVSNRPTLASGTKRRSLDSLATSTVTIRRPNSRSRPKSTDTSCNAEPGIDLVPVKNPVPSKWEKHRRRALVIPAQASDVTVVDLEPSASTSSGNDCITSDIFNKQVTRRTKRRCQSIGSTNYSTENSLVKDELPSADSTASLSCPSTSDRDDEHTTDSKSVGSGSITTEGSLEMESQDSIPALDNKNICITARGKRKYRRSTGSVPVRGVVEALSESSPSEPVKILDDSVLAVQTQGQTTLRRSTRRRSIELSLSQTPVTAAQGNKKTTAPARPVNKKVNNDADYDEEDQLRVIYAKKPYIPVTPSRLETIYSPNKKRGECNVFSKRKLSRTITFQPSEARLKLRRKKAMRNWPFLFEVQDVDEKLYRLLYNPE